MAKIAFNPAIEGIRGAMSKSGLIARQKIYRDARGRITGYGRQEAYFIANPRDFKRHPMRGKELAYHDLWREVCLQAKNELADAEKRAYLDGQRGVSLGSDAFFPFEDNIQRARKSGVDYVAEPGGSIRDDGVIACCDGYGMVMAFTGMRLFHH